MPSQTFFNLSDEKRNKIIDIALEEFALHDYKSASVTRIVDKANIAKGSMYRYFENKKDFYLYIINLVAQRKFDYIKDNLSITEIDFFKQLKEMHLTGLEFDLNNIKCSRIIINLPKEVGNEEIGEEVGQLLNQSKSFMKDFIVKGQKEGTIRNDLDLDLIVFIIDKINLSIAEYLGLKFDFKYDDIIRNGEESIPITMSNLEKELDKIIEILENGLSK